MKTSSSIPPDEPAWRTYLRAILFLTPAFVAWMFTNILVLPVLKDVWDNVGMANSRPRWFVDSFDSFVDYGRLIILAVILLCLALEFYLPVWPRYRRLVFSAVTFILNTAVLLGLASVCALAASAAHILIKHQ